MEEQLKILREELWLVEEREEKFSIEKEKLLHQNARLNCENEEMRKEMKALKGAVERVEEGVEKRMRENEERMEAMKGLVMGMMKTFMGEGAVGGVVSASGNGVIVEEKAKVSDNGEGSDSEIEDKEIRHRTDEQKFGRKNEKKGKSNVKSKKKNGQDESEDAHGWVKVVRKRVRRESLRIGV
ncbi:golgin subfamily A member 6-like protein 26 [Palaemon carinicauda]|uniref:golgin subfamily A member 6-like protein 26 n=1 Tax=Palaemon carinicauda TaxID=392227 RepID=UPI0035B5C2BC